MINGSTPTKSLPYNLSLERIVKMSSQELPSAAALAVQRIPLDDWFGKVSLLDTLMEIADDTNGTMVRRGKIIEFINEFNKEWDLKRGMRQQ